MHVRNWRNRLAAGAALLAALAMPAVQAAAPRWTVTDLGTLGGPGSYATAVSDTGFVVGCSDVMPSGVHAFIYYQGVMRDLGAASDSGGNSCALAVNDAGVAAGRSGTGELVVWSDGAVTGLGVKGTVGAINDAGVVVGSYLDGAGSVAFMYKDGALANLGSLGGDAAAYNAATAINARGEVVGGSNGHAFLWRDGAMIDLGTLGGAGSIAKGINDRGLVVGMAANALGEPGPFLYDGAMRALAGAGDSAAIDINNRAEVIGSAEGSHGYVVVRDTMTRLDTLPEIRGDGWHHVEPTAINDRGWIVGTAMNADSDTRAILLIPQR